jgi:ABC-type antimicrobial peptide transport system permease subunit
MDRLRQLPGVAAVAMAPFSLFELQQSVSMTEPGKDRVRYLKLGEVTGEWFDAINTRAVRGRLFTGAERDARAAVAVVDEEIARYLWGNEEPIGRVIRSGSDPEIATVTVIGVIPTEQVLGFREPEGSVLIPGGTRYHARTNYYVRTTGAASAMVATVREAVRAHDPRVPIGAVRTMAEAAAAEGAPLASFSSGMAALGAIALALAAIGLSGVLAFIVAQRRYEIGVRMALGARRGDVAWLVVRQALGLGAAGVLAGTLLMFAVVAVLRAIIWGLQPLDPSVLAGTALIMLLVSLLASLVPARRAVSVDPISSLRAE